MKKKNAVQACLLLAILACKPVSADSGLLESGGTSAGWKVRGQLQEGRLAIQTSLSQLDSTRAVRDLSLKVDAGGNGGIPTSGLRSREWMPMVSGAADPNVVLHMHLANGNDCYVNNFRPDTQYRDVSCFQGSNPNGDGKDGLASSADLRKACERLSNETIPGSSSTYAVYRAAAEFCECRNGQTRRLFYSVYDDDGGNGFLQACKLAASDLDVKISQNMEICDELHHQELQRASANLRVEPFLSECQCGNTRLRYAASEFAGNPAAFRTRCKQEMDQVPVIDKD